MRTIRILLLVFGWCGVAFSMEGPSNLSAQNEEHNLSDNLQDSLAIAIDTLDGVTKDLQNIYELLIDAASYLSQNRKLVFDKTKRFDDKLVEEAFRWLGGSIPRGIDRNFPEKVLKDRQFQATHLARAALFYIDIYIQLKLVHLTLEKPSFFVVKFARNFLHTTLKFGPYVPQSEYEIRRFGTSKPLDAQLLFGGDVKRAEMHLERALTQIPETIDDSFTAESFVMIQGRHDLRASDLKDAFDKLIKNLINAQSVNNGNNFWCVEAGGLSQDKLEDIDNIVMHQSIRNPKNREIIAKRGFLKHFEELVRFVKFVDNEMISELYPVSLEDPKKEKAKKPKPAKKEINNRNKTGKKTRAPRKKNNRTRYVADDELESTEESEALVEQNESVSSGEDLQRDKLASTSPCVNATDNHDENRGAPSTSFDNLPPLLSKDTTTPAKMSRRERKEKKKLQRALNHNIVKKNTAPSLPKMALWKKEVPYFTREVVEKFLDVFANKEGEPQKRGAEYRRQGWGKLDDFRATLERAGWLIDQRQLDSGLVINEKHGSSTMSFQMPNVSEMNRLYLKIHSDHEVGLHMRWIARHFIIKYSIEQGYPEEFWLAYYKEHFKD